MTQVCQALGWRLERASVPRLLLLLLARPVAWWRAHARSAWRAPVASLVALPLVLPPTVLGFYLFFCISRPPHISAPLYSSAGAVVYKRQVVFHATYELLVDSIVTRGLLPGGLQQNRRSAVYLTIDYQDARSVRADADTVFHVDIRAVVAAGAQVRRSTEACLITPATIPAKFLLRAIRIGSGEPVWEAKEEQIKSVKNAVDAVTEAAKADEADPKDEPPQQPRQKEQPGQEGSGSGLQGTARCYSSQQQWGGELPVSDDDAWWAKGDEWRPYPKKKKAQQTRQHQQDDWYSSGWADSSRWWGGSSSPVQLVPLAHPPPQRRVCLARRRPLADDPEAG